MAEGAELFWQLFAVAQVAASIAVTVHVLLRRRNTVAATAWIGLAWLAPAMGAVLYLALGINRIERRGLGLRRRQVAMPDQPASSVIRPGHLIPLQRAATRVAGRPLLAGNTVAPLVNGDEAYPAMLAAIADARVSIALACYIFRDDAVGRVFIKALADATARGVAVRVLIDGVGGGYFWAGAWRRLRAEGVPVSRFLHSYLPWRTPLLNLRSHKKLLVVDGRVGFTGGLNIGAENLEDPASIATPRRRPRRLLRRRPRLLLRRRRRAIRDTHFHLEGPVVGQMMAAFAEDWAFAADEELRGETWFPPAVTVGGAFARVVTSGPDHDIERIKMLMMSAISAARRRVRVVSPYFLPDSQLASTLELAVLRGVEVEIIVPLRSDYRLLDWAMRDGLLMLAHAGCRVTWGRLPFDHSKLMTVDGAWCLVGSANWDMRSLRLNFELNVEVMDPAVVAGIDAMIDATRRDPLDVRQLQERHIVVRLRDAAVRLLQPYL